MESERKEGGVPDEMTIEELMKKLDSMSQRDLSMGMFWILGYMCMQSKEAWDGYCKSLLSWPRFPKDEEQK